MVSFLKQTILRLVVGQYTRWKVPLALSGNGLGTISGNDLYASDPAAFVPRM